MPDIIECQCGQRYRIHSTTAADRIKCKKCGKHVAIRKPTEPEFAEVEEELDELEDFEEEEFAPPVRRRKSRSQRRRSSIGYDSVKRQLLQTLRFNIRVVMIIWGLTTMLCVVPVTSSPLLIVPTWGMCIIGLAGVNGRGIEVSREFSIDGDRALFLGSILIILASFLPYMALMLIMAIIGK